MYVYLYKTRHDKIAPCFFIIKIVLSLESIILELQLLQSCCFQQEIQQFFLKKDRL